MFWGCPSVRPSVRPKPEITYFHLYMGPLVHPSNRDRFAACPSVRRGFRAFARERMEEMVWNFACWCILGTFRTDYIMVMVCWFYSFWRHLGLVKWVIFGVSGHFPENAWWEWPEILHADVSWFRKSPAPFIQFFLPYQLRAVLNWFSQYLWNVFFRLCCQQKKIT